MGVGVAHTYAPRRSACPAPPRASSSGSRSPSSGRSGSLLSGAPGRPSSATTRRTDRRKREERAECGGPARLKVHKKDAQPPRATSDAAAAAAARARHCSAPPTPDHPLKNHPKIDMNIDYTCVKVWKPNYTTKNVKLICC